MTAITVKDEPLLLGLAHDVVDQLAADFSRPAFRAGLGVTLFSTIMLAKLGARPSVTIIAATMLGWSAERLYGMAEDISATSDEQRAAILGIVKAHKEMLGGTRATGED